MALVGYILIGLLIIIVFLVATLLIRTAMFIRPTPVVESIELPEVDADLVAGHLAEVIRCETISHGLDKEGNPVEFLKLHRVLEQQYPRVHATLQREVVNEYSLLYTWVGSNPELDPVLLAAHLDVVPADPNSLDQWEHGPYSGQIADGFVWGRGALDIKCQMIAALDAVEHLIKEGVQPERTVYLAFGHDEEIGGQNGAAQIAALLNERGVRLESVLDEGGAVISGVLPGLDGAAAMIGVAEKGHLTLKLRANGQPGHSSAPPPNTSIGIIARAVALLEAHPMPARLTYFQDTYRALGASVSPWLQMVFANLWLFGGIVRKRMEGGLQTNAGIRTTTAVTMIQGGFKDNVLPPLTEAAVNFRLLPGDTIAAVCERARKVIDDDRVEIEAFAKGAWEASPVSAIDSNGYLGLDRVARQVFEGAEACPYLVQGATDARYYNALSEQVFRFTPVVLTKEDLSRMHGLNERISVGAMGKMTQFFILLLQEWSGAAAGEDS